jgi:hypothetical protein
MEDLISLCLLDVLLASADFIELAGVSGREWAGVTGAEAACLISLLVLEKKSAP